MSVGAWVIAACRRCPNEPDGAETLLDIGIPRKPDREIEVRLASSYFNLAVGRRATHSTKNAPPFHSEATLAPIPLFALLFCAAPAVHIAHKASRACCKNPAPVWNLPASCGPGSRPLDRPNTTEACDRRVPAQAYFFCSCVSFSQTTARCQGDVA